MKAIPLPTILPEKPLSRRINVDYVASHALQRTLQRSLRNPSETPSMQSICFRNILWKTLLFQSADYFTGFAQLFNVRN